MQYFVKYINTIYIFLYTEKSIVFFFLFFLFILYATFILRIMSYSSSHEYTNNLINIKYVIKTKKLKSS